MLIDLLNDKRMSVYQCSKISGIPYTTLLEVVNGKTDINKCSAETVYRLAKALNIDMESLLQRNDIDEFETFKSNIKHLLKEKGDFLFLIETYLNDDIRKYWNNYQKAKALYLLSTVDYLSRINNLPIAEDYNDLRNYVLTNPLLSEDLRLNKILINDLNIEKNALKDSIPEFARFNIVERDLRDVA